MELTVGRLDWLVQLGHVCCHRQVRSVGLFLNLLSIISLYLLIKNENVHGNSLLLLYIHDFEISIVVIPTCAVDSIV